MSTLELVGLALSRLGAARLRATMTMLGVIIGVASVVALVAVGDEAALGVTRQLQSLGLNLLTVNPGMSASTGGRPSGTAQTLTLDDAAAIAGVTGVAAVEPEIAIQTQLTAGTQSVTTSVIGTSADYPAVRAYALTRGSFFNAVSVDNSLRVAVLGAQTAKALKLGSDAIGSTISINHLPFAVVGILEAKGTTGPVSNDDLVLIPVTSMQHYFNNTPRVRSIGVSVASAGQMTEVKSWMVQLLERRHATAAGGADDFVISDQTQLLGATNSISALLSVLLGGIAVISLLVGGIGIMNIMLVSVRERTREIGLRKAVGARAGDILAQFLVEALTMSALGGLLGVALGLLVSIGIGAATGWGFVFNPLVVLVALAFSLVVGCVFGVWPARQAARMDPILALRYE